MKKRLAALCLLFAISLICLTPSVLAAPVAELSMRIADWQRDDHDDDSVIFDLEIDVGVPSEPYASLDFNIVSSDEAKLHIIDLSANGDKSKLAIDFSSEYSGVYHKGRVNEADGSVSYLVGLFSQSSGNNINAETSVSTVRLRYTGDSVVDLSLSDLKLVYKNGDGEITAAPSDKSVRMQISLDRFIDTVRQEQQENISTDTDSVELPEINVPLNDAERSNTELPYVIICLLIAAGLTILVIIVCCIMKKTVKRSDP